jgi:hypothetical protein
MRRFVALAGLALLVSAQTADAKDDSLRREQLHLW